MFSIVLGTGVGGEIEVLEGQDAVPDDTGDLAVMTEQMGGFEVTLASKGSAIQSRGALFAGEGAGDPTGEVEDDTPDEDEASEDTLALEDKLPLEDTLTLEDKLPLDDTLPVEYKLL